MGVAAKLADALRVPTFHTLEGCLRHAHPFPSRQLTIESTRNCCCWWQRCVAMLARQLATALQRLAMVLGGIRCWRGALRPPISACAGVDLQRLSSA